MSLAVRHNLEYHDLARIQIDTAIELYEQNNFVSALTLAGAAEEISGKLLHRLNKPTILSELKSDLSAQYSVSEKEIADALNQARNGFKHYVEDNCEKDIDIECEARILIQRAVINYCRLCNKKTENMSRFIDSISELG